MKRWWQGGRSGVMDAFGGSQFVHCGLQVGKKWVSSTVMSSAFGTVPGSGQVPSKCLQNKEGQELSCRCPEGPCGQWNLPLKTSHFNVI